MTRLVIGLGNPGAEYAGTRHNVGYEVVDHLAHHESLLFQSARCLEGYGGPSRFQWARAFDPNVWLLKPETYMNLSGTVVSPFCQWSGIDPSEAFVVYDDMDLAVGDLRIRPQGGAGGQKGMRSIMDESGTDRFPRLRVGIGPPGTDAARHVLSSFSERERVEIDISVAEAAEAILAWSLGEDLDKVMTRFHSRWST